MNELIQRITIDNAERYGKIAGFILGTSMLFHYGRTFEINDLAVDPRYQHKGIGKKLLKQCLSDMKEQGIVGVNLITAGKVPCLPSTRA